ncbi:MAG: hypothetical protein Q9M28_00210 [Mariprofundaceae bacterium]|nr:hypothetical protein [Mariprofundaceae bacterium]
MKKHPTIPDMMAKNTEDTPDLTLRDLEKFLTRESPRTKNRREKSKVRPLKKKSPEPEELAEKKGLGQQQLQKDFPATKDLKAHHPNPSVVIKSDFPIDETANASPVFNKVPASLAAKRSVKTEPQKVQAKVQAKAKPNPSIRLLTPDMVIEKPKDTWCEKLSLLHLEKEEIRLLMKEVKKDVINQLPTTVPELVEMFLNRRIDSILQRKTFKDS